MDKQELAARWDRGGRLHMVLLKVIPVLIIFLPSPYLGRVQCVQVEQKSHLTGNLSISFRIQQALPTIELRLFDSSDFLQVECKGSIEALIRILAFKQASQHFRLTFVCRGQTLLNEAIDEFLPIRVETLLD